MEAPRSVEDIEYQLLLANRYQFQSWYIKLWRRRWYLLIPFWTIIHFIAERDEPPEWKLSLGECWHLAIGVAQGKMHWWHTMEEVKERLGWED